MTIAERIQSYYEHVDFISNYAMYLFEDTSDVKNRIADIAQKEYDFEKMYGCNLFLKDEHIEQIYEYILENEEEFTGNMNNYWVGDTCIASITYGEQEEQLTGLRNHRTGKDYTLPYLRKCFDEAGYYVNGDYAYYDLSGNGIRIDMCMKEIPLLRDLANKKIAGNPDEKY